ncbi:MAG: YhcH/YjgK/YiaL family protein [Deltaproteobacteria bacterium]|nr:MAG: YhcH/YjgK/YiaL family protein [Deltaproteobacteria bacterium]
MEIFVLQSPPFVNNYSTCRYLPFGGERAPSIIYTGWITTCLSRAEFLIALGRGSDRCCKTYRGRKNAKLEAHRQYIDIQFTVAGRDEIGWKPAARCTRHGQEYNEEKDVVFFSDEPDAWVATPAGTFGVFFPEDAHAPLGGTGPIHKVVVKVAVEW